MISLKSEITKKLLNFFFLNPQDSQYVNELVRKLKLDKRNLVKKLKELEAIGILKSITRGNLKLYSINKAYPLYQEYERIVFKTVGIEAKLKEILNAEPGVKQAYLYGSYASGKFDVHSDIDVLIVGDYSTISLQKKLSKLQREVEREINAIHMSEDEFSKKLKRKDNFLTEVFKKKFIKII